MNYFLLAIFWAGAVLIHLSPGPGLKERAALYLGTAKENVKKSWLSRTYEGAKASLLRDRLENELTQALAYVKNIVILGRGRSISAQLLAEELADMCRLLKPCFTGMAADLHVYNKSAAAERLYNAIGSGYARDLGNFLAGWEDVPQDELLQTIEIYSQNLRDERHTRRLKRDEMISDLIYFPVVMNCMAVLLNFIYVAFFIEQQEIFRMLF